MRCKTIIFYSIIVIFCLGNISAMLQGSALPAAVGVITHKPTDSMGSSVGGLTPPARPVAEGHVEPEPEVVDLPDALVIVHKHTRGEGYAWMFMPRTLGMKVDYGNYLPQPLIDLAYNLRFLALKNSPCGCYREFKQKMNRDVSDDILLEELVRAIVAFHQAHPNICLADYGMHPELVDVYAEYIKKVPVFRGRGRSDVWLKQYSPHPFP